MSDNMSDQVDTRWTWWVGLCVKPCHRLVGLFTVRSRWGRRCGLTAHRGPRPQTKVQGSHTNPGISDSLVIAASWIGVGLRSFGLYLVIFYKFISIISRKTPSLVAKTKTELYLNKISAPEISYHYRCGVSPCCIKMKWNESGFRPPLCTYRLNWARRTYWGWWDDWDDTVLQTHPVASNRFDFNFISISEVGVTLPFNLETWLLLVMLNTVKNILTINMIVPFEDKCRNASQCESDIL